MKRIATTMAVLLLAGCGSDKAATPRPQPTPTPLPPVSSMPVPNPRPATRPQPRPTPAPAVSLPPADACGAKALQSLVGKPRSAIPVPVDVRKRRVACTTCPVTMDFNPERLNIFFDAQSGVIKEVKCG